MDPLYIVNRYTADDEQSIPGKAVDPAERLKKILKQAKKKEKAVRLQAENDCTSPGCSERQTTGWLTKTTDKNLIRDKGKKKKKRSTSLEEDTQESGTRTKRRRKAECAGHSGSSVGQSIRTGEDGIETVSQSVVLKQIKRPKKGKQEQSDEIKYEGEHFTDAAADGIPNSEQREMASGEEPVRLQSDSTGLPPKAGPGTKKKRRKKKGKRTEIAADTIDMDEAALFPVLGDVPSKLSETVTRVLPDWLSHPEIIKPGLGEQGESSAKIDTFSDILSPAMMASLSANKIERLFPVQEKVIPWLLSPAQRQSFIPPRDICVSAPTGSGKTLAYVIPIVESLRSRVVRAVRAVVVLPVRELAAQLFTVFLDYVRKTTLKVQLLTASKPFAEEQSALVRKGIRGYQSLVDIIVTTPHRLLDHLQRTPGFSLQRLRFFILDEADRVVEDIRRTLIPQVEAAVFGNERGNCCCCGKPRSQRLYPHPLTACSLQHCREPAQKLLYSATLTQDPEKLQSLMLFQPILFTASSQVQSVGTFAGKYTTPQGLSEFFYVVKNATKPLAVWNLVVNRGYRRTLCFTRSREEAHRLSLVLKFMGGVEVQEFSADLSNTDRQKVLKAFASGKLDVLVCSTVLARGVDIDNVQNVICYEPPKYIKTYVHEVGRTARAGKPGTAITLMRPGQVKAFKEMLSSVGKGDIRSLEIEDSEMSTFHSSYREALERAQNVIGEENQKQQESKKPNFAKRNKVPLSAFGRKTDQSQKSKK